MTELTRIECLSAAGLALARWKSSNQFAPIDPLDKMIDATEDILDVLYDCENGNGFDIHKVLNALGKLGANATKSPEFFMASK